MRTYPGCSRLSGRCNISRTTFWFLSGNNIHLYGGGTLDGNGQVWWDTYNNTHVSIKNSLSSAHSDSHECLSQDSGTAGGSSTTFARPIPLTVGNATNVVVENIRQIGSPFWVRLFPPSSVAMFDQVTLKLQNNVSGVASLGQSRASLMS